MLDKVVQVLFLHLALLAQVNPTPARSRILGPFGCFEDRSQCIGRGCFQVRLQTVPELRQ